MKKIVLPLLILLGTTFFISSCHNSGSHTNLTFRTRLKDPLTEYAVSELERFLEAAEENSPASQDVKATIRLKTDPALEEGAFAVRSRKTEEGYDILLTGQTPADVLYAAYTFLEKGGFVFDITGPVVPAGFDWTAVANYREKIVPAVIRRGIRQHINFPMDLSAWPVEEAKEYIRNLTRMRFNAITFHSYPGQWYEVIRQDTVEYAGHFFYGDVHTVPDYPAIRKIAVNKKYFCIPEIEPYFENTEVRSKLAIEWLQDVIGEAKHCGMRVRFSFEPRDASTDLSHSVETVRAILKEYPMIDELEFITEEAGGWGPRTTRLGTEAMIRRHFGEEMLRDSIVMAPVREEQSDLAYIYGQVGHDVALMQRLRSDKIIPDSMPVVLGIYVVIPEYARPAFYLARRYTPPGTQISIMPGHHSLRVKNNTAKVLHTPEDWQQAVIYSWIEFDGMMYIQQNGISGIQSIVQQAVAHTPDGRARAILYNHWRTAENRVTARYAALSGLYGALAPGDFYESYARSLGIAPPASFARAMTLLDSADLTAMHNVSGFAFCWVGRWRNGGPLSAFPVEKLEKVRQSYQIVLQALQPCGDKTSSTAGRDLLTLLDNRIRTTLIYLKAFEKGRELNRFDTRQPLTDTQKEAYVKICNEMLAFFEQYIDLYAGQNADRGCAGNLVSLWHGPVKGTKIYRQRFGGVDFDEEVPPGTAIDAPPLPAINNE
jgi:hypothetical protein